MLEPIQAVATLNINEMWTNLRISVDASQPAAEGGPLMRVGRETYAGLPTST